MEIKIPSALKSPVNSGAYKEAPETDKNRHTDEIRHLETPRKKHPGGRAKSTPNDPEAPHGRKKDGTPQKKSPGPLPVHQSLRMAALRTKARIHSDEILEIMMEIVRDPETPPAVRVSAGNAVWDRAWGKPKETLEIDNPSEGLRTVLAGVSSSDLVELMRVLKAGALEAPRDVTPLPDVLALPSNPEK